MEISLEEKKAIENDILFQIDMELYDKFNDKFCEINEWLGEIYSYKDLEDLENCKKDTEIELLRQAVLNQQKEIEQLKSTILVANKLEDVIKNRYIPKSKIEELINNMKKDIEDEYYGDYSNLVNSSMRDTEIVIDYLEKLLKGCV